MVQLLHPTQPTASDVSGVAARGGLDDRRLGELAEELRAGATEILSLDCFDTLLWRRVPKPTDAFTVLGQTLLHAGLLGGGVTPQSFAHLRVAAEHAARQRRHALNGSWEINLSDIYAELAGVAGEQIAEFMRLEVETERKLTVADPLLAETLANLASELGLRVVVVSDMYLGSADIGYLLDRPEFAALPLERVICSNEEGVGKEHGLWHALPARLGVRPDAIVHVGNNHRADVAAPRQAGVRAVYYAEVPDRMLPILTSEGSVAAVSYASRWCDPVEGDGGMTAMRGRAAYAAAGAQHADQVAWETGACVLGPVMASFAEWIHERLDDLDIDMALCLMREGRFLQRVLEGAARTDGKSRRSELLWVSREALARASFYEVNAAEMEGFFTDRRPPRLEALATTLGLDLAAFSHHAGIAAGYPHLAADPTLVRDFLGAVLSSEEHRETVRVASARRRANLIRHLERALDGCQGDVALVDVGWRGTIQEKLQDLADREGLGVRFHGLYLMADDCPVSRVLAGHRIEGFLARPGDPHPETLGALRRNRYILEEFLLSDDGSTLEHGSDGHPVCAGYRPPAAQCSQRRAVQDGVVAFVEHAAAYRQSGLAPGNPADREPRARRILERFLCEPTLEEAQAFGDWELEDDHGNVQRATFVPNHDHMLRRCSSAQLAALPFERIIWPAGASVLWDTAGPSFGPPGGVAPAGMLGVELRTAAGAPTASSAVLWELSRPGLATASWVGPGADTASVRLVPASVPGLLRLDFVELALENVTGWRGVVWSWRSGADPGLLEIEGCNWIGPGLLNLGPGAALAVRLGGALPPLSQLRVTLSGAFLGFEEGVQRLTLGPAGLQLGFSAL